MIPEHNAKAAGTDPLRADRSSTWRNRWTMALNPAFAPVRYPADLPAWRWRSVSIKGPIAKNRIRPTVQGNGLSTTEPR